MSEPTEEKKPAPAEASPPPKPRRSHKRKAPVVLYLCILFLAAFVLLAMSYFMQQRKMTGLTETIDGLKDSVSAMQTVQDIQQQNQALSQEVEDLKDQVAALTGENTALNEELAQTKDAADTSGKQVQALEELWRIEKLYRTRYYTYCRNAIEVFQSTGLSDYLPTEPLEEGELSAAEEFAAIVKALY